MSEERCEHCNARLIDLEVITCDPCAAALALSLAGGPALPHWIHGHRAQLVREAEYLRDTTHRPDGYWRAVSYDSLLAKAQAAIKLEEV